MPLDQQKQMVAQSANEMYYEMPRPFLRNSNFEYNRMANEQRFDALGNALPAEEGPMPKKRGQRRQMIEKMQRMLQEKDGERQQREAEAIAVKKGGKKGPGKRANGDDTVVDKNDPAAVDAAKKKKCVIM